MGNGESVFPNGKADLPILFCCVSLLLSRLPSLRTATYRDSRALELRQHSKSVTTLFAARLLACTVCVALTVSIPHSARRVVVPSLLAPRCRAPPPCRARATPAAAPPPTNWGSRFSLRQGSVFTFGFYFLVPRVTTCLASGSKLTAGPNS